MSEPSVPVTILVPVYRNVDDVARCINSVLGHAATCSTPSELVIIDDASPEGDVREWLDDLAAQDHVLPLRVERNSENLGFVATANRGLRAAVGDVVILNADTAVTAGWLDRLADAASGPDVATVTPLSNFGSICTLPAPVIERFGLTGGAPDIDGCADFVTAHSAALRPDIIAGVGFCMYLTRRALDRVGLFDEDAFGTGYGEEVDYCVRATRLGFRHLADDTTFVFHRGGGSFGVEGRAAGKARGSKRLHRRYPFLRANLRAERRRDPLAVPKMALELGLAQRQRDRDQILHVLHSPPDALGGTEMHVLSLIDALWGGFDASILYHVPSGFVIRTIWADADGRRVEREYLLPGAHRKIQSVFDVVAAEAVATALDLFEPDAVHIQNLVGYSLAPLVALEEFAGPVVCSVRDLYLACPNHWLLTPDLLGCGIPEDLRVCAACLPVTRGLGIDQLHEHRQLVADHLDVVDAWVVATRSAGDFLQRAYDLDPERIHVIEHGALLDLATRRTGVDEASLTADPLRVAFVGVGWPKKGLDVVNAVAAAVAADGVEIHHFGKVKAPLAAEVISHGRYDNEHLPALLDQAGIALVMLPAPYAETFGHVLTESLIAGRPVIGTAYGALGERIRAHRVGWTVDPHDTDAICQLLRNLDRSRDEVRRATQAALAAPIVTIADSSADYARLYRSGRPNADSRRKGAPSMSTDLDDRLRRQLRAMAAVNRQLHDQIAESAGAPGPVSGANVPASTTHPDRTEVPPMSSPSGSTGTPYLTRRSDGVVFLVDGDGRRKVRSGLLAAALQLAFGSPKPEGDEAYGAPGDVPELEILRGPSGDPFVLIDGTRRVLKGLPVPRTLTSAEVERHPMGPALDLGRAVVARSSPGGADGARVRGEVRRVLRGVKRRLR